METEERIVHAMAELMRAQGYTATGMQQLARVAGAPTGSIYHHFRGGKRDVAAAALRRTGAAYLELLPLLLDPHPNLTAGVEALFESAADNIETAGWANMCPVSTVAGEVADTEPSLRDVGAEVMASWVDEGAAYLRSRGLSGEDARTAINAILAGLEGAYLMARVQRTTDALLAAGRATAAFVATLPVTEPVDSPDPS